ncbi:hypothetical protein [Staphylococcus capitis]|uniref:hypothetical protein n=1 Tax=Staphylococcus capitis TaxID=29388 RepID=UPI003D068882
MRRRAASALLFTAATCGALLVAQSPVQAAPNVWFELLQPTLPSMLPGQQGWVGVTWAANNDVCDVKVTASGNGFSMTYPANTATYSSLFQNDSMLEGGIDFTAFNLQLDPKASGTLTVNFAMSYRVPANGHAGDPIYCQRASLRKETATATMTVKTPTGPAFTQRTTNVAVSRQAPAWTKLEFSGYRPGLTNFRVALTPPKGITVTYPGDGQSAGLNAADTLAVGYDDQASVRLDASGAEPGTYTVPMTVTNGLGSSTGNLTVTVS